MTGNPFPVMHGSMWKEPQTLEECDNTRCRECAYNGNMDVFERITKTCIYEHRNVLIMVDVVE